MKTTTITVILLCVVELLTMKTAQAQGTIFVSSLGQPTAGSMSVANDTWVAASFQTGPSPGGYALNAIQLLMSQASGIPNGFTVMLYSFAGTPPHSLAALNGSDPATSGVFTYSGASFSLAPLSTYWFAVTATTPVATGSYRWSFSDAGDISSNGWKIWGSYQTSADGIHWTRDFKTFQFAVNATAVPEPSSLALWFSGGIIAAIRFIRRRKI